MKKILVASFFGFCLFGAVGAVLANYYDNTQEEKNKQVQMDGDACLTENQQEKPLLDPSSKTSEASHCVDEKETTIID
jgi:hypothetical protein